MRGHKDLSGKRLNMLTVLWLDCEKPRRKWQCRCDCGNIVSVYECNLGRQKSCGCIKPQIAINNGRHALKHGDTHTRLYRIWESMRRRCNDINCKDYSRYGGRGISVCDDWMEFNSFKTWANSNGYSDELSIDRIDVNGSYSPDNCRWASNITQCNNRRNNRFVTIGGELHTIAEWSRISGISPKVLRYRVESGWEESRLLSPINSTSNRLANRS